MDDIMVNGIWVYGQWADAGYKYVYDRRVVNAVTNVTVWIGGE